MQPPIPTGTVLQNRYRLINLLGQGGFGRTYLVEDQGRFNELCALKELTPPQTGYALGKSKELFQREAQILYQIEHPQIPKFRAMFEEDQRLFLAQDFVEGKTYREILDDRKSRGFVFSEQEIVQLMQQVLPVLSYLHQKGIIHRDIAPDNMILRDRDKLPVLIDFGVVKEIATRLQQSSTNHPATTVGKLGYAPIEQMQTGNAYPNSDLYALAVSAIVLLTGREPQEVLDDNTMTWNWQRWCQVSPGFAQVIDRMLSITPNQRYVSATAVEQALAGRSSVGVQQTIAPNESSNLPSRPVIPSSVATIAVIHDNDESLEPRTGKRSPNAIPERTTLWDDPWAIALTGIGLATLAAIGIWALRRPSRPEIVASPEVTVAPIAPTLKPSIKPTPKPSVKPSEMSESLDITPGKPTSRSGKLTANQTLTLNFAAKQGQTLDAFISGEGVLMTLSRPDGQLLGDRAKRVPSWVGELPLTGDYSIQLKTVRDVEKSDYKIDLKLVDPVKPTPPPTPTPIPPTPIPNPGNPERVLFQPGTTTSVISGSANGQQVKRYIIEAKAGQLMEITLQGAKFNVIGPSGNPVPDASNRSEWRALQLPVGDYQVEIVTTTPADYTLSVTVQ